MKNVLNNFNEGTSYSRLTTSRTNLIVELEGEDELLEKYIVDTFEVPFLLPVDLKWPADFKRFLPFFHQKAWDSTLPQLSDLGAECLIFGLLRDSFKDL